MRVHEMRIMLLDSRAARPLIICSGNLRLEEPNSYGGLT